MADSPLMLLPYSQLLGIILWGMVEENKKGKRHDKSTEAIAGKLGIKLDDERAKKHRD